MANVKIKPTEKDMKVQNSFFLEASYMGGTNVLYSQIDSKEITEVSSEIYTWKEPVSIDVIYDERPKVSLLKNLNWYREDTTIQPRIMYVPSVVDGKQFTVKRGDLIRVNSDINRDDVESLFQVSEVRTELVSLFFICNIVPYREQIKPTTEPKLNNKWLDV